MPQLYLSDFKKYCEKNKRILIIIKKKVYDVTEFTKIHPGGSKILESVMGTDATNEFTTFHHSLHAMSLMENYEVGTIS